MKEITFKEFEKIASDFPVAGKVELWLKIGPRDLTEDLKIDFGTLFGDKDKLAILKAINNVFPISEISFEQTYPIKEVSS